MRRLILGIAIALGFVVLSGYLLGPQSAANATTVGVHRPVTPAMTLPHGLEHARCTCSTHGPGLQLPMALPDGPNPFVDEDRDDADLSVRAAGLTPEEHGPPRWVPEQTMSVERTFHQWAREYYRMVHRQPAPGCVTTRALLLGR